MPLANGRITVVDLLEMLANAEEDELRTLVRLLTKEIRARRTERLAVAPAIHA